MKDRSFTSLYLQTLATSVPVAWLIYYIVTNHDGYSIQLLVNCELEAAPPRNACNQPLRRCTSPQTVMNHVHNR